MTSLSIASGSKTANERGVPLENKDVPLLSVNILQHGVPGICVQDRYCDCYRYPFIASDAFKEYTGGRNYSEMNYSSRRITRYNFMWVAKASFSNDINKKPPQNNYINVRFTGEDNFVIHPDQTLFDKMEQGHKRKGKDQRHPIYTHKQSVRDAKLKPESTALNALQKENQNLVHKYVYGELDEAGVPFVDIKIGGRPQFKPSMDNIREIISRDVTHSSEYQPSYIKVRHTDFRTVVLFTKLVRPVSPRYIKKRPIDYVFEGRVDGFNDKKRGQFVIFAPKGCGKSYSRRITGGGDTDELHHANEGTILKKDIIYSNNVDVIDKRTVVILPDFETYVKRNMSLLSPVTFHDYSMIINRAVINKSSIIFSNDYVHDVLTKYYPTVATGELPDDRKRQRREGNAPKTSIGVP